MALRWRIRHKLLLGLGVVVGIIAVLLTGTLYGLAAFTTTVKIADSKLAELHHAELLKRQISELRSEAEVGRDLHELDTRLKAKSAAASDTVKAFTAQLQEAIDRGRDADPSGHEKLLAGDLANGFQQLDAAIEHVVKVSVFVGPGDPVDAPGSLAPVRAAAAKLDGLAGELCRDIYDDLWKRFGTAKKEYTNSLVIVLSTSILGVLLMAGLLRFFYDWVFHPIRDLQLGVNRVARGDFTQPIELNSQDELQELAAAFNDMTARLHATYRELSRQVHERGKQLVRSERLASVGFLAAGVAHEINNPLASIAFCAEGLQRRVTDLLAKAPQDRETITKYLTMIQQEAFRCKQITQGLLEFSRVGEGERQATDLGDVVQSVLDVVQHLRNCQGKKIVFRPAGRPVALANPQEIKQVILNVVVNALDSMDEGGVLTISLAQSGPTAEIRFADTGCGMPPEVLDKIFEPFFTANRTGKGTGLGLSISHRIVTQHGGEIEATSPGPGRGSTFAVRLPLPPAAPAVKEVPVAAAA
ncbi:MAG TPA: ATP-binding protein [Gemmataceae bacterium]